MNRNQQTIKNSVKIRGVGLHTGDQTIAIFNPAPPDTGVIFIRDDLAGKPKIPARLKNVVQSVRGTTIAIDGLARVHTIEHILATLMALEIDNVFVHLNSSEPPILDGSARIYAEALLNAGIVEQPAEKKYIVLEREIEYVSGETRIVAIPSFKPKVYCQIDYQHPMLGEQATEWEISPETFVHQIAPARTFCFDYEIEHLKDKGLARGGSLENAIVIGADRIHNQEGKLRFPDEFARHKLLDLLGDIYLLGRPLRAEIRASRCGHSHNINFARLIEKTILGSEVPMNETVSNQELDINAIKKVIPHRYPFLFIDRVRIIEPAKKALGYKYLSANESFFQGHFPERPIMPGVLIVEAMAQTSCVLFLSRPDLSGKMAYFMSIDNVKFRKPVEPGCTLELEVEVVHARERMGKVSGKARLNSQVVAEATFSFILVDK